MGDAAEDAECRADREREEEGDVIAATAVEEPNAGDAVAVRQVELNLFGGGDPQTVVERSTAVAKALADVIEQQELFTVISQRRHVRVEGWTLLGSMLGVFPIVEWTRQVEPGVWEARCVAKTLDGSEVGAAEAMCSSKESRWKGRDDYAIRSMAQTRATSKALRLPLGFVMALAGYDVTPLEEMDADATRGASAADQAERFDPGKDRLDGFPTGDGMMERLAEMQQAIDPTVDWAGLHSAVVGARYSGKMWAEIDRAERGAFMCRWANAVTRLTSVATGDFPPLTDETVADAFAWAYEGLRLEIPHVAQSQEDA